MSAVIKYFSGDREISSVRWLQRTEAAVMFPGVRCVRVDGYSVMAGWTPGHMHDDDLLPVTRMIEYSRTPSLHKCDARCQHARGRKCECSCGGKNHGHEIMITITQAAKPGLGARRLRALCYQGRIPGAQLLGGVWLLPEAFTISPGRPVGNPTWRKCK